MKMKIGTIFQIPFFILAIASLIAAIYAWSNDLVHLATMLILGAICVLYLIGVVLNARKNNTFPLPKG